MNTPNIGKVVVQNADFLRRLAHTRSSAKRMEMVRDASSDQLLALLEIVVNILKSRFPLTKRQHNRLRPYAPMLRDLSRVRSAKRAREILQHGSGSMFSSLLLPIISALVDRAFSS